MIAAAREAGVPVIGELELAWRLLPNPFVAVTGTNGKTTTTELLGAIWPDSVTAGNVGTPLSSLVDKLDPATTVICECSSFQLEDAVEFAPDVAILLNLEEDHLDRHGTRGGLPRREAARLRQPDARRPRGPAGRLRRRSPGAATGGDRVRRRRAAPTTSACAATHNRRERAWPPPPRRSRAACRPRPSTRGCARSPASRTGSRRSPIAAASSTSTTRRRPTSRSAAVGIAAFEGGVHVILGGSLKGGGFTGLREVVADRCKAAYLIGEAAPRLHADLEGTVPLERCGDLDRAVAAARAGGGPRRRDPALAGLRLATTSSRTTRSAARDLGSSLNEFSRRRRSPA